MRKYICFIFFFLCLSYSVHALYSDRFLIGAFGLNNMRSVAENEPMILKMRDAHYNFVQTENWTHFYTDTTSYWNFAILLQDLNAKGLDTNVLDKYYYEPDLLSPSPKGIEFLTSSNYFRFEAEYQDKSTQVNSDNGGDLNSDIYFYLFSRILLQLFLPALDI